MTEQAWQKQSNSLVEVQRFGYGLEARIQEELGWPGWSVMYDHQRQYGIQVDGAYPSFSEPQIALSVTYTNPDSRT